MNAAFAEAALAMGGIDAAILSAGIGKFGAIESYDLADWDATLATNLTGPFLCAKAAIPHLRQRGGGHIIAISSGAGKQGYAQLAAYSASKFGLMGLMQGLAGEVGDEGIKVSAIVPGSIMTPFGGRPVDEKREAMTSDPGRKYLEPDDVAEAVLFLMRQPRRAWTQETKPLAVLIRVPKGSPEPRGSPLVDRWTTIDGLRIFSRVSESASDLADDITPIVHIHGFAISGRYLEPTARLLAEHYPTYIPDLPGHGHSEHPARQLDIPELATALAGYLDIMDLPRAVLLGNSMGCLIAAEFAHRFPDRVERGILVSPAGGPHNQPLVRAAMQLARDGIREPLALARIALPDYVRFGLGNTVRAFHRMTRYPTTERLTTLPIPFLAIIGNHDPLISASQMRAIFDTSAIVDLVYHFNAAHAINFSHPEALARVTHAYLQGQPLRELFVHGEMVAHIDDRGRKRLPADSE